MKLKDYEGKDRDCSTVETKLLAVSQLFVDLRFAIDNPTMPDSKGFVNRVSAEFKDLMGDYTQFFDDDGVVLHCSDVVIRSGS